MKLKTSWENVDETSTKIIKSFQKFAMRNVNVLRGMSYSIENTFGFPYTSTSEYAALWNCQAEAEYIFCTEWRFEALAVSEEGYYVAVFEHENTGKFDRMYIIIGKEDE